MIGAMESPEPEPHQMSARRGPLLLGGAFLRSPAWPAGWR